MRDSILDRDIDHILMDADEINCIADKIASEIDNDYKNRDGRLLLMGILKGSVVFMGDLMKKISLPLEIDFMRVSTYGSGTKSSGKINILLDIHRNDLSECNIIIIEDIIDSGRTLLYLTEYLKINGAKSVSSCTLLDKPSRREVDFSPDYIGKVIPDEFVVGYGLDFFERYRELPYIGVLKESVYKNFK